MKESHMDTALLDSSLPFPGHPFVGKVSARRLAYFYCTHGKTPPSGYRGVRCKHPSCVNPWHVKWFKSTKKPV